MKKSEKKLLLNAEPFGFGPTAAIASFFPYLKKHFEHIDYLGGGHTLDLQKSLEYGKIYDSSNLSTEERKAIISECDIFFTALDFSEAKLALDVGTKVIIYDPLTWYWNKIPSILAKADLYIAQDFFGVQDRINKGTRTFPNSIVVPPIVNNLHEQRDLNHVLINLGGLKNPMWSEEDTLNYARLVVNSIKEVLPQDEKVVISTNKSITDALNDPGARTYPRDEMLNIIRQSKYAFMTPGLGNIYDVAQYDLPTLWLPPANDSQGQQSILLKEHKILDQFVDWSDLGQVINYHDEQPKVLEAISKAVIATLSNKDKFVKLLGEATDKISQHKNSATSQLFDKFGSNGAKQVATTISDYAKNNL